MSQYVIEGTWEDIERRKSELIGHQLRLTIKTVKAPPGRQAASPTLVGVKRKRKLVGYGAFKGMTGGTEALFAEKQAEIELEERIR